MLAEWLPKIKNTRKIHTNKDKVKCTLFKIKIYGHMKE